MHDIAARLRPALGEPAFVDASCLLYACEHRVLADAMRTAELQADAMVVDAPYSARTHAGHDDGATTANRAADWARRHAGHDDGPTRHKVTYAEAGRAVRRTLAYAHWTDADVVAFVSTWAPLVRGWWFSLTDHVLWPTWERSLGEAFLYTFPPLSCVEPGATVRMVGDGHANWTAHGCAARPRTREFATWGALRGAYIVPPGEGQPREHRWIGGKALWTMREIVADHAREGQLVVDPCCGMATTGIGARIVGRRALLCDRDPAAINCAAKRLRGERTKPARDDFPETPEQPHLFGSVEKHHDGGAA